MKNSERPKAIGMLSFGAALIVASVVYYPLVASRFSNTTIIESFAYANFLLTVIGLVSAAYGLRLVLRAEASRRSTIREAPSSTLSTIAFFMSERRFGLLSSVVALAYAISFALISRTLVYEPFLSFSEAYGAKIPSAFVLVCCGTPGEFPRLVAYLTEHLGLLITPLNLILLFSISWLFGVNMRLTLSAYSMRRRGVTGGWLSGFGAVAGLLTSCPSCSGLLLTSLLGGVGVLSITTALASLQPVFIAASIPVLVLTPVFTSKTLLKTLQIGCSPASGVADR